MEDDRPFPEDILRMVMQAFALMHEPMVRLLPNRKPEEVALLARMMFSAVHGMVALGLEHKLIAVPINALRSEIGTLTRAMVDGLTAKKE